MKRKMTSNHNPILVILIILQQHTMVSLDKPNENENSIDLVSGRLLYILISFSSFFFSINNINCQYQMTNWIIINELYVKILIILIFNVFIIWFNNIFPCYYHNRWFHQLILSKQTSKTQYQGRLRENNQENDNWSNKRFNVWYSSRSGSCWSWDRGTNYSITFSNSSLRIQYKMREKYQSY